MCVRRGCAWVSEAAGQHLTVSRWDTCLPRQVISSVAGKVGVPYRAAYSAAKHALHGFCDALRVEVQDSNASVTVLVPGLVRTDGDVNTLDAEGERSGKRDSGFVNGALVTRRAVAEIAPASRPGFAALSCICVCVYLYGRACTSLCHDGEVALPSARVLLVMVLSVISPPFPLPVPPPSLHASPSP